jgi:hypothetical protein
VAITPPEPQRSADSSDGWKKLTGFGFRSAPTPATEINNAATEFNAYTSHALELEAAINRGEAVPSEKIGNALDNARAWTEYFGPDGPLRRGLPASTAAQEYVDALARVSQQQRVAQQWVEYFTPLWDARSSSQNELARDEQQCLQKAAQAEQILNQRQMSFALSRFSYENFLRQQGRLPPAGGGIPTGRPGPGSPEWTAATMGLNCYWCGFYLNRSLPPGQICPNCGRFPQPGPSM